MSKSQTTGLGRRFTKKIDTMRFTHNDINFDFTYESQQNWSKHNDINFDVTYESQQNWSKHIS